MQTAGMLSVAELVHTRMGAGLLGGASGADVAARGKGLKVAELAGLDLPWLASGADDAAIY